MVCGDVEDLAVRRCALRVRFWHNLAKQRRGGGGAGAGSMATCSLQRQYGSGGGALGLVVPNRIESNRTDDPVTTWTRWAAVPCLCSVEPSRDLVCPLFPLRRGTTLRY